MTIRPICPKDHEATTCLMEALPEWFTPEALEHIRVVLRYHRGFVACNDISQVVGFVTYFVYDGVGVLSWIGVLREYHHQGIGTELLHAIEQAFM